MVAIERWAFVVGFLDLLQTSRILVFFVKLSILYSIVKCYIYALANVPPGIHVLSSEPCRASGASLLTDLTENELGVP